MRTSIAGLTALLVFVASPLSAQPSVSDQAAKPEAARAATPVSNAGPAKWDAAGRVNCSVDRDTFARTCGFRLVRNRPEKSADIWIRNLAKNKSEYRVLHFANEAFTSNDNSKVAWERRDDKWRVSVDGKEFYLISDALIQGN